MKAEDKQKTVSVERFEMLEKWAVLVGKKLALSWNCKI